jgi:hypothetical protein
MVEDDIEMVVEENGGPRLLSPIMMAWKPISRTWKSGSSPAVKMLTGGWKRFARRRGDTEGEEKLKTSSVQLMSSVFNLRFDS